MADSAEKDKQEFIQKIERLSDREFLNFMRIYTEDNGYESDVGKVEKTTFIKKIVNKGGLKEATKIFKYVFDNFFIEDKYFDWLDGNLRAQIFTLVYVRKQHDNRLELVNKSYENERQGYLFPLQFNNVSVDCNGEIIDAVYEVFDKHYIKESILTRSGKECLMEQIKALWSEINKDCDYTEWVNNADESEISWLERYLNRKDYYIDTIEAASTLEQRKALCLASLDLMEFKSTLKGSRNYNETREKTDFIDRMKRSWSQKVYCDSGRERKKYHLPLANKTKQRLDKIVGIEGGKQADILETLINNYYESNYLDSNGKDKY